MDASTSGLLAHPHGAVALCRSPRGRRGYDYRQLPPARPEPGGTRIQHPRCANPPPCYAGQPRTCRNVLIPPTRRALRRAHPAYRCRQDESADTEKRLRTATEIRDSIEIVHTSEYANFLKAFFPVFNKILQHGSAKFEDCPEQKLRNVLLEILNRLPHNETLRQYVADLLTLSMHILNTDNEENSLICLRIIFDLHKNYRPTLDAYAQPFLNFVRTLYTNFQGMVGAPPSASPLSLSPCRAANKHRIALGAGWWLSVQGFHLLCHETH